MSKSIKNITFDYGGVLRFYGQTNPIKLAAKETGISEDDFRKRYFELNHLSNCENMLWLDMFFEVLSSFNLKNDIKEATIKIIKENQKEVSLNTELISALPSLKEQGLGISLLSNNTSELRDELEKEKLTNYFDEIVISGEVGFQKPDKRIFEILFSKLDLHPSEVLFIDDAPKSLENSKDIGFVPILFRDNAQLASELIKLGITL